MILSTRPSVLLDGISLYMLGEMDMDSKHDLMTKLMDTYRADIDENPTSRTPVADAYCHVLEEIVNSSILPEEIPELKRILNKIESHATFTSNKSAFQQLELVVFNRLSEMRRVRNLERSVVHYISWYDSNTSIRDMLKLSNRLISGTSDIEYKDDVLDQITNTAEALARSTAGLKVRQAHVPVEEIDFDDPESLTHAFNAYRNKREVNVLKTGLRGLNRILEPEGGLTMGEFSVVCGDSHDYKSGILMDFARWIAVYNKVKLEPGIRPCVIFYSLENEIYENLMDWLRRTYYIEFGEPCPEDMEVSEMIKTIQTIFLKNGFLFKVRRKLSEDFGIHQLMAEHDELKKDNIHVVATINDYYALMKRDSDVENYQSLCKLAQGIKSFANHTSQAFISGHQLNSPKVSEVKRLGSVPHPVLAYDKSFLADATGCWREFDLGIFLHVQVNHAGHKYLTMAKRKHRYRPPVANPFTSYLFAKHGILDDLNEETSRECLDIHADSNDYSIYGDIYDSVADPLAPAETPARLNNEKRGRSGSGPQDDIKAKETLPEAISF